MSQLVRLSWKLHAEAQNSPEEDRLQGIDQALQELRKKEATELLELLSRAFRISVTLGARRPSFNKSFTVSHANVRFLQVSELRKSKVMKTF